MHEILSAEMGKTIEQDSVYFPVQALSWCEDEGATRECLKVKLHSATLKALRRKHILDGNSAENVKAEMNSGKRII